MSDTKRRAIGFLIGVVLGLPYSYVSQFINVWMLPGIPLFEPPVGRVATVLLTTLAMGVVGLIVAWEKDSFWGIVGGALFTVATSSYLAYLNSGSVQTAKTLILFVFTFLPRIVLYIPVTLLLLWILKQIERATTESAGSGWRVILVLLVVIITAVAGGGFSRLPSEARQALRDANQLTLDGISAAASKTDLPAPLLPVEGFSKYANGPYTLRWSDAVDTLNVLRPATDNPVIESLIIIRFENGYKFGCVYTPPSHTPNCINITPVQ